MCEKRQKNVSGMTTRRNCNPWNSLSPSRRWRRLTNLIPPRDHLCPELGAVLLRHDWRKPSAKRLRREYMFSASNHDHESKTRVQLDMSAAEIQRLNWIMEVCDLTTRKELFNNALTILEWATRETVDGRKIASFDDTTKDRYILSMPALNAAANQARHTEKGQAQVSLVPTKKDLRLPHTNVQSRVPAKA